MLGVLTNFALAYDLRYSIFLLHLKQNYSNILWNLPNQFFHAVLIKHEQEWTEWGSLNSGIEWKHKISFLHIIHATDFASWGSSWRRCPLWI